MTIDKLCEIEMKIYTPLREMFGVSRHDLKILRFCKDKEETAYSLKNKFGLESALTSKRITFLEKNDFILRVKYKNSKKIVLKNKSWEVINYLESVKIDEV